jgi:hypothetical protein
MANLTENSQIKSFAQLRGHTRIWKNDELVFDEDNAIIGGVQNSGLTAPTGLKAYLARSLDETIDRALNSRFATSNVSNLNYNLISANDRPTIDAAFSALDGIFVGNFSSIGTLTTSQTAYAMVTTALTETNSYGRKWRGVLTATTAISASHAVIGHSMKQDTRFDAIQTNGQYVLYNIFATPFAEQTFQTITLASGDSLTIDWEIYIA